MESALLERIDRWLADKRPDYYACLQPGVTAAQLDTFETRFAVRLPLAFRDFYKWRNGQESGCSASFQENRMFSSLESVAEIKDMLDGMIGFDFEDPRWWRRGWIPFLDNGGGDHLCLDLTAEDGGKPGQLVCFWHDWEDRSVEFPDFETWLRQLAESMENGTLELA